jgi:hypothetical protein
MARLSVLVVALLLVASAFAQSNFFVLDRFDVGQSTISLNSAGTVSNYNCAAGGASTAGLNGGIRKLQITAPTGTNVGNSVQLGVFIPTGQTTAPNGVQSGNNNLQSPTFQILYRIDGNAALCSSGTNTASNNPISKAVNNLNVNLSAIGATGFVFQALGDVTPNQVTVTFYTPSGSQMAQSNPITVQETGQTPMFTTYTLNFSDNTKWTSGSTFTGTLGALEISWPEPANLQFAINLVELIVNPTTNVGATVFVDCGCNGFVQGSGDSLQSGVTVTLTIGGTCAAATQSQTTSSSGTVNFAGIPGGCTYTLSVSGLSLCATTPSSQAVLAGQSVNFAIQGTSGALVIPADRTVNCGSDTSTASTGIATGGSGNCGGSGTPTFVDSVTPQTCTAPGGTVSVIKRTWSLSGVPSQTQTITVVDTKTAPTLVGVPAGSTLTCNQPVPTATVTGTSCTAVTVTSSQNTVAGTCNPSTCTNTGSVVVTYTGTDQCGNTATRSVTYTQTGCAVTCPPPPPPSVPPPPTPAPPPPTQLPTNANCRFICDDDDSSAMHLMVSLVALVLAALVAF